MPQTLQIFTANDIGSVRLLKFLEEIQSEGSDGLNS